MGGEGVSLEDSQSNRGAEEWAWLDESQQSSRGAEDRLHWDC